MAASLAFRVAAPVLAGLLASAPAAAALFYCTNNYAPGTPGFNTAYDLGSWYCASANTSGGAGWTLRPPHRSTLPRDGESSFLERGTLVSLGGAAAGSPVELRLTLDIGGAFLGMGAGGDVAVKVYRNGVVA